MDFESQIVGKFLGSIASICQRLNELVVELWRRPDVKTARLWHFVPKEINEHRDVETVRGISADIGVSAELIDGSMIDWWIEFWLDSKKWRIEHAVYKHDPDEDGCHPVITFPEQAAKTLDGALEALSHAVDDFVS